MSESSQKLRDKVTEWLGGEGYRLEYIVHKAFRDIGLNATMSHHVETEEGKCREVDVAAFQQCGSQPQRPRIVHVLCECKYSQEKPWLLMSSGLQSCLWADWASLPQSPRLRELSHHIVDYEDKLRNSWHFANGQPMAHSLLQAFRKDNRDMAFDALQKIANAAWDHVETPDRRGASAALVTIPCLVVEAPLFWAWFDYDRNGFTLEEVKFGRLSWSGARGGTMIDVVHLDAVLDYATAIKNTFAVILDVLEDLDNRFEITIKR